MSPRPDVRAERIPQIIQSAMTVFAKNGLAQTRMEDIALEAGLSKATLYLYFTSKDDIIAALLQTFFAQGFTELQALLEIDQPVQSSLMSWSRRRIQELQGQAALLSIGYEFYALAARQPSVQQVLRHYYQQYRSSIAALIQKGVQRGEFQPTDTDELATAIIAVYEGANLLWLTDPESVELISVVERAVRVLLENIAPAG